jgi:hypothetical protein
MHGPINVKSLNNTSKWLMGFNSAFKGLKLSILAGRIFLCVLFDVVLQEDIRHGTERHDQASERGRWCSRYDKQACLQVSPSELAWECGPCRQLLHPVETVGLQANEGAANFV